MLGRIWAGIRLSGNRPGASAPKAARKAPPESGPPRAKRARGAPASCPSSLGRRANPRPAVIAALQHQLLEVDAAEQRAGVSARSSSLCQAADQGMAERKFRRLTWPVRPRWQSQAKVPLDHSPGGKKTRGIAP